jgi:hypothetical protein
LPNFEPSNKDLMEPDKTTFNIKVYFEDAKIKDHTKSSPKIEKMQNIDPKANGKV